MAGSESMDISDRVPSLQHRINTLEQRALDAELDAKENERRINELKKNLCNVLRIENWESMTFSEIFAEIGAMRGANEAYLEALETVCQS